jgi:hypothetical protein
LRLQIENVFLQAKENAARGIATDAAIGDLHAGKPAGEIVAPPLSDGIAEHYEGVTILFDASGPFRTAFAPEFTEPIIAPNGALAGKAFVGLGKLELRGSGFFLGEGSRSCECEKQESENEEK